MDIGFLFGWAKEQGIDLSTKSDGSINIPAAFALYDEWKKKGAGGDREHRKTIMVAIAGTLAARTGYPVQNLRASLRGTRISTTSAELFEPGQELLFLGRWWLIDDVSLDVSDYAPQSAAVNGTGHPKTFLDIIGQQSKGWL